jgi:hypothetical protein
MESNYKKNVHYTIKETNKTETYKLKLKDNRKNDMRKEKLPDTKTWVRDNYIDEYDLYNPWG